MPEIPVDLESLPTARTAMDESLTYKGFIRRAGLGVDKNKAPFMKLEDVEVTEPIEWAGRHVSMNYIPIPPEVLPTDPEYVRRNKLEVGVRLKRFAMSFKPPRPLNTDTMVGCEGRFTIVNEEYQGEMMAHISGFVF